MYTFNDYKKEIMQLVEKDGYDPVAVAKKSYFLFMHHQRDIDRKLYDILLDMANMDMGSEFELTKEEFIEYLKKCEATPDNKVS